MSVLATRHDLGMSEAEIRTVGVPKEIKTLEYRVAMTPDGVRELEREGIDVFVETGAGEGASITDADYVAAGAEIVPSAAGELAYPAARSYVNVIADVTGQDFDLCSDVDPSACENGLPPEADYTVESVVSTDGWAIPNN